MESVLFRLAVAGSSRIVLFLLRETPRMHLRREKECFRESRLQRADPTRPRAKFPHPSCRTPKPNGGRERHGNGSSRLEPRLRLAALPLRTRWGPPPPRPPFYLSRVIYLGYGRIQGGRRRPLSHQPQASPIVEDLRPYAGVRIFIRCPGRRQTRWKGRSSRGVGSQAFWVASFEELVAEHVTDSVNSHGVLLCRKSCRQGGMG